VSLDAGVNPKIVSERIGHASLAFTLQIYTHRTEGRDRAAAAAVASLLLPGLPASKRDPQSDDGEADETRET
jgi:hypothetical protein